ncbi:MAG: hypothetical protein KW793_03185 [Candidatus Doudnabacteria bacterium]|nr:hypothetical protein [Candidatus Doudnabacteria bacterium]
MENQKSTRNEPVLERPIFCEKHGIVAHRLFRNENELLRPGEVVIYAQCTLCYRYENCNMRFMARKSMSEADFKALIENKYF